MVPPQTVARRSPAAKATVAKVADAAAVTRVLAVVLNVMAVPPVRTEVPAPGAVVPVSFVTLTVGTVPELEQMHEAETTR